MGWRRGWARSESQSRTVSSSEAEASHLPSAAKATCRTGPSCLRTSNGLAAGSGAVRSQSRTFLSSEAEASHLPSAAKATCQIRLSCLRTRGLAAGSGAVRSQSRTVSSLEAEASHLPSARRRHEMTWPWCWRTRGAGGGVGRGQVPEPDRLVVGGGGEVLTVGREGDVVDRAVVLEDAWPGGGVGRGQVPEPDRLVLGGGGERTCRRPRRRRDDWPSCMRTRGVWRRGRARSGPRAGPFRPWRRRRVLAVGREGDVVDRAVVLRTRGLAAGSGAVRSQSRTVPSLEAEASHLPSAAKAT